MTYPLGNSVKSKSGKRQEDINLDAIRRGEITPEDIKISKDTLLRQAEAAKHNQRHHLSANFERASELVDIPDALLLEMYGKLRPYRSTKKELLDMADVLKNQYQAHQTAALVTEAAHVYEKRGVLV